MAEAPSPTQGAEPLARGEESQSPPTNVGKRILLVEDEVHMMEMLKFRLLESKFEVATAADGFAALNQVRTFKPNLVILDLMIPKMDGYTICRLLKFSDEYRQIPVIILSARSTDEDMRRGLAMGADAYMTKPYEPAQLLAKINELLTKASQPLRGPEADGATGGTPA